MSHPPGKRCRPPARPRTLLRGGESTQGADRHHGTVVLGPSRTPATVCPWCSAPTLAPLLRCGSRGAQEHREHGEEQEPAAHRGSLRERMLPPPPRTSPTPLGTAVPEWQGPGGPSTVPCRAAWQPQEGKVSAPRWAPPLAPFGAGESPRFGLGQGGGRAVPGRVTTRRPRRRSDRQHPVPVQHAGSAASPKSAGWAASGLHLAEREQRPWLPHGRGTGRRRWRVREGTVACVPRAWPRSSSPRSPWPGLARGPVRCPGVPCPGRREAASPGCRVCTGSASTSPSRCLPACPPARSTPRHRRQLTPVAPARRVPLPAGAPHHPGKAGKSGVL